MDQEENPYRPPSSPVRDMNEMQRGRYLPANGAASAPLWSTISASWSWDSSSGVAVALIFGQPGIVAMQRIPNMISGSVLFACYYVVFEGIWSRTPGIMGPWHRCDQRSRYEALDQTGCWAEPPAWFIPFEAFSFLFGATGWHDSIPHTRVVRCR